MYKILKKEVLNQAVIMMEVEAPYVAARCEAGQFVIVRVDEEGERIPLTIADFDREKNSVTIIFQVVGYSTKLMAKLEEGDSFCDFVGPLGQPAPFKKWNSVIGIAGGVGAAPLYPQLKKLSEQGVEVSVIIGGRSAEFVILAEKFAKFCKNVYIMTDDGSAGTKGLVTEPLKKLCEQDPKPDEVVAIGPPIMMKFCAETTRPFNVHTVVSLNTIMIDGTGMCGCCRVTVDGRTQFVCVDGPEFDGHLVDFDNMMLRMKSFKPQEQEAFHKCRMEAQAEALAAGGKQ